MKAWTGKYQEKREEETLKEKKEKVRRKIEVANLYVCLAGNVTDCTPINEHIDKEKCVQSIR